MKMGLLIVGVALVLGGLVGTLVVRDPGYVLIAYDQMALETSLWFAVLLLVAAYFVIRAIVFLFVRFAAGRGNLGAWNRERRFKNARSQRVQGLLLMAEGDWAEARRLLVNSASRVTSPLINYLSAARAAHELGDADGRDELLRQAHESTPGARFAVGLTQAQLQMSAQQWEQCLATLLQLKSESPRHPQVLSMLASCYEELQDWQALIDLLPAMKKSKVLAAPAMTDLQQRAWSSMLLSAGVDPGEIWKQVPKDLKRNGALVESYARMLVGAGKGPQAEPVVRSALAQDWQVELVGLYGEIISDDVERQLVVAEGWLKARPNDAALLLTLGRICLMNHLWAKAREYLEASLRMRRAPEVYGELGRLCSALGDAERGNEYLGQSLPMLPDLPMPDRRSQALGA
ncbi:MAG: heme biosynthesis protein HemY [Gammaproteobacteria bacterium]|nr:heme biosynthesis protein HemY [Gammaproteobacteria bacterium]